MTATAKLLNGVVLGISFVFITTICYFFAWNTFDQKYNFLGRAPSERREAFKTEAAFYYNFFEDVVDAQSFTDGVALLEEHPAVEAPKTINAIMRFNIYPEIAIGFFYRMLCEKCTLWFGYVDSIIFYTKSTMFLWGVDKGLIFLTAAIGCGAAGGGNIASIGAGFVTTIAGILTYLHPYISCFDFIGRQ